MHSVRAFLAVLAAAGLALGCGVDDRDLRPDSNTTGGSKSSIGGSTAGGTGGTSAGGSTGSGGSSAGGKRPIDGCPAGVSVILGDGTETQIALIDLGGAVENESFISSASTRMTEGLSFPLSGDVRLPSARPESGRLVILDRRGANPITFADGDDASVLSQLAVGTGFDALPSDYLEVGPDRAFVSRFADNPEPGRLVLDRGGDLLVIDSMDLVESIELPRPDELPPGPLGMVRVGDVVWVGLERSAAEPDASGDSMLVGVGIESERVEIEHVFEGLKGCGRPALAPSGETLAIACRDALVLFDPLSDPPAELQRFTAEDIAGQAIQSEVVFASDRLVLLKTEDSAGSSTHNRWLAFDLEEAVARPIAEAAPDEDERSRGNVYGAMSCAPGCSDVCLLANAGDSVLERVRISASGELELLEPSPLPGAPALVPRGLAPR